MIFTVVLYFVQLVLSMLLALLPDGSPLPQGVLDALSTMWMWIRSLDFILPLDAFAVCIPIAFSWYLFVFAWKFIHWILRKLPFLQVN